MTVVAPSTRGWWERPWAILLLALASAIPLLGPDVPPLVDLPGHMGRYRVQLDGGAHPWLAQWYNFNWSLIGNLGIDLLIEPLAPILGLEPAVKLIIIAIPVLTAGGAVLLLGEELTARLGVAAALVAAGMWLGSAAPAPSATSPARRRSSGPRGSTSAGGSRGAGHR